MCRDYIDSLRYMADEFKRHYLGKWNIEEENKMNIHEKLRADVSRIFRGRNPLDFIEDVKIVEHPSRTLCEVTLRVPSVPEIQMGAFYSDDLLYSQAKLSDIFNGLCSCGVPKAPEKKPEEKKIDPMEAVDFLKPTKIIYSGPKTIVFWPDGTKTIVSLMEGKERDDYTAYCAAVVKKMFGATHKAKKFLESVAVRPEPKPKKAQEETIQVVPTPVEEEDTCNG